MDIKYRKIIARVKPLHRIARIIMYNSGFFFYRRIYKERNYDELFKKLHDSKLGKCCFIIGNGPSLKVQDLEQLKEKDCFASNNIFKLFPYTTWRPQYYFISDRYMTINMEQLNTIEAENVFLGDYFWRFNKVERKDAICLHQHIPLSGMHFHVSEDISKKVITAHTVSYIAMQVAAYLGYKEIYLIGFDHNYGFEKAQNGSIIKTNLSASHFYKDDVPEEIIADVNGMTKAYISFREYAKDHGIVVKNATRGGKLEVFERVDFDSLFST